MVAEIAIVGSVELAVEAVFLGKAGGSFAVTGAPETVLAPVSGEHFADEEVLYGGLRIEAPDEVFGQCHEDFAGFAGEQEYLSQSAVKGLV